MESSKNSLFSNKEFFNLLSFHECHFVKIFFIHERQQFNASAIDEQDKNHIFTLIKSTLTDEEKETQSSLLDFKIVHRNFIMTKNS